MPSQFRPLWELDAACLIPICDAKDFDRFRRSRPGQIEALVEMLSQASGRPAEALISHLNFLQAFSFARMVGSVWTDYLHSYFFYDRSLMRSSRLLLDIPSGSAATPTICCRTTAQSRAAASGALQHRDRHYRASQT